MTTYQVNTTYEPFSNEPEYIEANREFVASMDFSNVGDLLDLACGTGLMTELAIDVRPELRVVGLDLSHESICLADERFATKRADDKGDVRVGLGRCSADRLPLPDQCVDGVIMGNAIHMLPDEAGLVREIHRVLRPGGWFAFNSSFYAGTFAENTEKFYHDWIKLALLHVMNEDRRLRKEGKPGIPRKRGTVAGAFSNQWLSKDEWAGLLERAGLRMTRTFERTVVMTAHSFQTIGAYGGFAEVLLSGYPVRHASIALQATAEQAMKDFGTETIPRYWLEMTAVR